MFELPSPSKLKSGSSQTFVASMRTLSGSTLLTSISLSNATPSEFGLWGTGVLLRDLELSEGTSSDVGVFALFNAIELAVLLILDSVESAERIFFGLDG